MLKQKNVIYTDQEKKDVLLAFENVLSSVEAAPFLPLVTTLQTDFLQPR